MATFIFMHFGEFLKGKYENVFPPFTGDVVDTIRVAEGSNGELLVYLPLGSAAGVAHDLPSKYIPTDKEYYMFCVRVNKSSGSGAVTYKCQEEIIFNDSHDPTVKNDKAIQIQFKKIQHATTLFSIEYPGYGVNYKSGIFIWMYPRTPGAHAADDTSVKIRYKVRGAIADRPYNELYPPSVDTPPGGTNPAPPAQPYPGASYDDPSEPAGPTRSKPSRRTVSSSRPYAERRGTDPQPIHTWD